MKDQNSSAEKDIAFLKFLEKCEINFNDFRNKFQVNCIFPMNVNRKRMGCLIT